MAQEITQQTRQDLPDWARPYGAGSLVSLFKFLYPDSGFDEKGDWHQGRTATYEEIGGPMLPFLTGFTPMERAGQEMAVNQVKSGQPIRNASDQWTLNALGGDPNKIDSNSDLARQYETYMTAGPLAGASRTSLLDALMGGTQGAAEQSLLDSMYGGTANQAQQSAYNTLGKERDLARDASAWSYTGPLAGSARSQSQKTIEGDYLSPYSNPWLTENLNTGLKGISDAYKYATAPSTAAQFARSGSFGGSAHQQTAGMQQFELGRNLSDFTNQFLGENYSRERGNQLAATGNERNFSQSALEAERGRQYGTQENALQRSLQSALDERGGWRQLLDNQLTRGMQASEGELGRGVQVQSLLPQLMQSRYQDADVLRSLGSEYRNFIDAQNNIDYQNKQQQFQWPFRLYDILGSGLASFTGGGGVTTSTSSNPNALSTPMQAAGMGALGTVALSQLGSWLYPQAGGDGAAAGAK